MYRIFLIAWLSLIALPSYSQVQRDTVFHMLGEIDVTATKTPRSLSEVPGRVSVLSAEEMSLMPASRIDDKLKMVSGVNVRRSFGVFTMRPTVSVRGLSGDEQSRTLVLLDGVPVNTSDEGGVNWNSLNMVDVEQMEVFKGPGSSLYGSNAMGGVINIITREPEEPLSGSAEVTYGTFNTMQSKLSLNSRAGENVKLQLSGFYNTSDGYDPVPDSMQSRPEHQYSVPRYVDEGGICANVTYSLHKLFEVDAGYDLFRDKRGEGTEIEAPEGMYRNFDIDRVRLGIRGEDNDFRYRLNMFYQREDYFMINERMRGEHYVRFDVDSERDDRGLTLDLFREAGPNHTITAGLDAKIGSVDGGDFYQTSSDKVINKGSMRFFAGYLQDEISLSDNRLNIQMGLRYDNVRFYDGYFEAAGDEVRDFATYNGELASNSWSTLSPRIALRYTPGRTMSGFISYGRGFRASILDDLSRSGWMWIGPKVANPQLGPETLDNLEAGMDIRPHWRWNISPTVFYSLGHDFLYYVATGEMLWDSRPIYRRENVSSVRIGGTELDMEYYASDQLSLFASYSLHHSEILAFEERTELEGNRLTYAPRHQLKGSIQWRNRFADIGLTVLYKSQQFASDDNTVEIEPYATVDVMFSRSLLDDIIASIEIINLLDNRHMENLYNRSPGRLFTVKIGYDL